MPRRLLAPAAFIALSFSLSGCAEGVSLLTPVAVVEEQGAFSDSDVMFAQMMIPHHEQAVLLATLAESNTEYSIILDLASRIADAQKPEIATMKSWLAEAGASEDMGHSMSMPGMISDDDMRALEMARNDEFDVLFLTHMIAHHEGAVAMANDVIATTTNPDVITFANNVIAAQTLEIEEMQALLYG
jgi:uncharacterized protein (DUF305 family)